MGPKVVGWDPFPSAHLLRRLYMKMIETLGPPRIEMPQHCIFIILIINSQIQAPALFIRPQTRPPNTSTLKTTTATHQATSMKPLLAGSQSGTVRRSLPA